MNGGHCAPILTECLCECEITKTFMGLNNKKKTEIVFTFVPSVCKDYAFIQKTLSQS